MRYLVFLALIFSLDTSAKGSHSLILQGIKPHSITIIGETHKRPESFQFFQSIISDYRQQHSCLTVALEIASNQQSTIDQLVQDQAKVADIEIAPPIDHPDFRVLIENLAELQRQNDCVKLIAIDADIKLGIHRDAWMAKELASQVGKSPILVLLGSLHTSKLVEWNSDLTRKFAYVAELLTNEGYTVRTYPQIWKDRECNTHYRFIKADEPEATELVVDDLFGILNAVKPNSVQTVVDGVILWGCNEKEV
ncbi:MAG: hypothetical protein KIS65_06185 [Nitrosomonas sp.]|nr:hypothetical protein [Nitrosomonas sp.]